jgi:chemotaxis protein histidine kinase CheA
VTACLLVRSADRVVALPLADLEQVIVIDATVPAPGLVPAVRGVVALRDGLAPVVHLGALLSRGAVPAARGEVGVVVRAGTRRVVLEVDQAVDLVRQVPGPLPADWGAGWASGGVRWAGDLVPVAEVGALVARMAPRRAEGAA